MPRMFLWYVTASPCCCHTHLQNAISHCRSHDLKLMTENDSHQTTPHTKSLQSLCPLASHFIPTATPFTLGGIFCLSHIKTQCNKQTRIFSFNFTIKMTVCESCELSNQVWYYLYVPSFQNILLLKIHILFIRTLPVLWSFIEVMQIKEHGMIESFYNCINLKAMLGMYQDLINITCSTFSYTLS
jgi:hypothetical protein